MQETANLQKLYAAAQDLTDGTPEARYRSIFYFDLGKEKQQQQCTIINRCLRSQWRLLKRVLQVNSF